MYQASPKIPTEGLIFYVDAASKLSTNSPTGDVFATNFHDITGNYPRGYANPNVINTAQGAFDTGEFGGYWTFDGTNDYAKYGQRAYVSGFLANAQNNRQMSIIAWYRTHSDHNGILLSGDDVANSRKCFQFKKKNNGVMQLVWQFYQNSSTTSNVFATNTSVSNNVWHQFAATVDGYAASDTWEAGAKIYLDGVEHAATNNNVNKRSGGTISNPKIVIGMQEEGDNTNSFDGDISNIKMYERVLSADEIKQDYNAIGPRFGFDSI